MQTKFNELKDYISKKMLMQHIYQPVMLKALLESKDNRVSVETIAKQFLMNDEPQLQYYKYITRLMPGRVLRSHNVVRFDSGYFVLNLDRRLTQEQIGELVELCTTKITDYETMPKSKIKMTLILGTGHMLVSPLRHIPSFFEMGAAELNACILLLERVKGEITRKDSTVTGFNIGVNDGRDAGQTIMHCHMHLIPRRKDDVADPRGGIRHIIPGRGYY